MATHRRRATGGQRRQHFTLLHVYARSAGGEELVSVAADDFSDFELRSDFCGVEDVVSGTCRSCSRGTGPRIGRLLQMAAPHMRVMRRRAQRPVSQDLLNGEQVDPRFQEFRGKRVPQRMSVEPPLQAARIRARLQAFSTDAMVRWLSGSRLGNIHTGLR